MTNTRIPLNIQLFAEGGEGNDDGGTQQQQQDGNGGINIDYEKIADILAGKQSITEEKVLSGYFKQQGLSGDEMKQAISAFKEQKAKNTPDVAQLQNTINSERSARLLAEINQSATLEAIKQGVDVKTIPHLLKLADFKDVADKDGNINAEKLSSAIKTVLDDIPALKNSAQNDGNNSGVQKIGGDGSGGSNDGQPKNNTVPTKKWNRFN
jgi:hypothetical protein